jgi:membrane fusion protein, multidrug efflux system
MDAVPEPAKDVNLPKVERAGIDRPAPSPRRARHVVELILAAVAAGGAMAAFFWLKQPQAPATAQTPIPTVTVSLPISETIASRTGFLGQFSAVDEVEIRAQVGGVLTKINFQDGQLVNKGDLLFVIDPRPYEITVASAVAAVNRAQASVTLAQAQLWRAQELKQTSFGTAETVDQRAADLSEANAAQESAVSAVRNAQLDLDYCQVKAPFTGRVSSHRVSVGSLVSGSRAGSSPTTLLTTIVSTDPIYLNFDMSENDYFTYARAHPNRQSTGLVDFRLSDEKREMRHATLDFIDNAIDRASGTIHARATAPNPNGYLVPGSFARLSLVTGLPHESLLVPETALSLDQKNHVLMTVGPDDVVTAKVVEIGDLVDGLRVVTDGLNPTDRVVVDGLARAIPGRKVKPRSPPPAAKG